MKTVKLLKSNIIKELENGATIKSLAVKYNLNYHNLLYALKKNGIHNPKRQKIEIIDDINQSNKQKQKTYKAIIDIINL